MNDLLAGLNEQQLEAVTTTEGYVRVVAGAGSGKTRAISCRFAYLVCYLGILPGNILCVTFTNKAAAEMRRRIHRLTGDNDTGYVSTFHGFCVSILQEDSNVLGYPKSFLVLDNSDIDAMLGIIYEERGLTLRDMSFSKARDMIEMEKLVNRPDYYMDMLDLSIDELRNKYLTSVSPRDIIFYGYLWQEKKCFGLDYNDLIKFSLHIFKENEEVRLKWQKRLEYIMIDEFQDIDAIQYELMQVLCGYHHNLFIVGDPDQTIYSWRGADIKFLLEFDKHYPNVRTIMMNSNYRSTPQILDASNSLISKNVTRIPKDLVPVLGDGRKVLVHHAVSSDQEAEWISREISRLHNQGVEYGDITILYRAHYITRAVENGLLQAEIPYRIYSGVPFFGRMEIKDALAYLRMSAYKDDLSFARIVNIPRRNVGKQRMSLLEKYSQEHECSLYEALKNLADTEEFKRTGARKFISLIEDYADRISSCAGEISISEFLTAILHDSGYEAMMRTAGDQERLDNLAELKQSIYEYETTCGEESTIEHYLAHLVLFTNSDTADTADKVRLMTVHAAKGLEFPYVFICGLNEGIFPSKKTRTLQAMEEERRLCFVAMTRAMKELYISESEGRNLDGSVRYPSRFILDIDSRFLEFTDPVETSLLEDARSYVELTSRFLLTEERDDILKDGSRVKHPVFGEGDILSTDREKGAYLILFDQMDTPRQISFRAGITPV